MPGCLPRLTSFFGRFLIDFCSQLGPPEPPKSLFFLRKNKVFSKNAFRDRHRFSGGSWRQLGSILAPKIHQNPPKSRFQEASKLGSIFRSIFGSTLGPIWPPRRGQDRPKRPPRRARRAQEAAKTAPRGRQDGPKRLPKNRSPPSIFGIGRQEPPRAPQDPSRSDF